MSDDELKGRLSDFLFTEKVFDRLLFMVEYGSRAFHTNHANSDYDIRGVYVPRMEELISLFDQPDQKKLLDDTLDIVIIPLNHYLKKLLTGNVNYLEFLYLEKPIKAPAVNPLINLVDKYVKSKEFGFSYIGYEKTLRKDFRKGKKLKQAVLAFRVLLTARELLDNYRVCVDMEVLTQKYDIPLLNEYFRLLRNGQEYIDPSKELTKVLNEQVRLVKASMKTSKLRAEINTQPVEQFYYSIIKNEG